MDPMTVDRCRPDVVERLAHAGLEAMMPRTKEQDTSAGEVLSAVFTMALRCIQYVQKTGTPAQRKHNLEVTRETIMRLLANAADETSIN